MMHLAFSGRRAAWADNAVPCGRVPRRTQYHPKPFRLPLSIRWRVRRVPLKSPAPQGLLMRNVGRKLAFVLASSNHGTMIVNRFDRHMVDSERGYGVGFQILEAAAFDPTEVEIALQLLDMRRRFHGDGVVAIDCGANIGVHTIEWATSMTGWGS